MDSGDNVFLSWGTVAVAAGINLEQESRILTTPKCRQKVDERGAQSGAYGRGKILPNVALSFHTPVMHLKVC